MSHLVRCHLSSAWGCEKYLALDTGEIRFESGIHYLRAPRLWVNHFTSESAVNSRAEMEVMVPLTLDCCDIKSLGRIRDSTKVISSHTVGVLMLN